MADPTASIDDEIAALKYQIDVCNVMRKGIEDNHISALRSALARLKERERLEDPPASVIARGVAMLNTPRSGPDETLVHDIWQAMLDELRALAEPSR